MTPLFGLGPGRSTGRIGTPPRERLFSGSNTGVALRLWCLKVAAVCVRRDAGAVNDAIAGDFFLHRAFVAVFQVSVCSP